MAVYDKLVRDRIPEIINANGKKCRFSQVSGEQLIAGLEAKLLEEWREFLDSERDVEELADILEVIDGLAAHLGSSFEEVLQLKDRKRSERGGFDDGIWLEWVED
ncbi:MAG TPA: nucleoside triphosphate pyrophosphohydrolase [Firmicutes bacterium]|nr:MAG: hypothetical protein AA931_10705 [Peptococcaceae bacterium 1109]HHT73598.1 nucleoside triphosphate pyrophosphohydrolase [Bacillota bacterium]